MTPLDFCPQAPPKMVAVRAETRLALMRDHQGINIDTQLNARKCVSTYSINAPLDSRESLSYSILLRTRALVNTILIEFICSASLREYAHTFLLIRLVHGVGV